MYTLPVAIDNRTIGSTIYAIAREVKVYMKQLDEQV